MKNCKLDTLPEDMIEMLHRHIQLDGRKLVSYLPINTIKAVMQISVETYTAAIKKNGGSYIVFGEGECCISSGAVYAFLPEGLDQVLKRNSRILAAAGIPCEPNTFIQAIAKTWFDNGADIVPLLNEIFGDAQKR